MSSKKSIGVFDSGLGGLTVLRGIVELMPEYNYIYLGDTARAPYGTRSQKEIYDFTLQALRYLFGEGAEIVILACNTASSEALRKIQKEFLPRYFPDKKVLGVLVPAAEAAGVITKNNTIGVMATPSTVASGAFEREIEKCSESADVKIVACPLLVPIIEAGEGDRPSTKIILEKYLYEFHEVDIDTIILGCTHYSIIEKSIAAILPGVNIVSAADVVPIKVWQYLQNHSILEKKITKEGFVQFCTTDSTEKFQILGSQFYGQEVKVEKINL